LYTAYWDTGGPVEAELQHAATRVKVQPHHAAKHLEEAPRHASKRGGAQNTLIPVELQQQHNSSEGGRGWESERGVEEGREKERDTHTHAEWCARPILSLDVLWHDPH